MCWTLDNRAQLNYIKIWMHRPCLKAQLVAQHAVVWEITFQTADLSESFMLQAVGGLGLPGDDASILQRVGFSPPCITCALQQMAIIDQ